VTGNKKALIENHRGILEYGNDRIVIASRRGKLSINGAELNLTAMNKDELLISGKIQNAEWE